MSTPEFFEEYELFPEQKLYATQRALEQEFNNHPSAAAYLNSIQQLYSQNRSLAPTLSDGDLVYSSESAHTSAHQLTDIARFITLTTGPQMDPDADSFYRGLLLGSHFMQTAGDDTDPITEASLYVRNQYIQSTYWADTNNRLTRQAEVSDKITSKLMPPTTGESATEKYERVARTVSKQLETSGAIGDSEHFLYGYRFMLSLYLQLDLYEDIEDTLAEYDHIPEAQKALDPFEALTNDLEVTAPTYQRLDSARTHIIDEYSTVVNLAPEGAVDAVDLSSHLSKYSVERELFIPGDLIEVKGTFFYSFEYEDKDGDPRFAEEVEEDEMEFMGTFMDIVVVDAPTPKAIHKFANTGKRSYLKSRAPVPAIRLSHPSIFALDSEGERLHLPLHGEFTFTIPITYLSSSMGKYVFGEVTERAKNKPRATE